MKMLRWLWLVFVLLVLAAGVVAVRPIVEERARHARALVVEGERSLAKGERARAVVALERARLIAPREPAVRTASADLGISDPEPRLLQTMRVVSSYEWFAAAVVSGWISAGALAAVVLRRRRRTAAKRVALAAGALCLLAAAGVVAASESETAVVSSDGTVRLAPYEDAAPTGGLPAGTVVVRGPEHGAFVRVRSGDGVEGWLREDALVRVARTHG